MKDAPTTTADRPESGPRDVQFDSLERVIREAGPGPGLDLLIKELSDNGDHRALLDALLLKARHDLGLPLVQTGRLSDLPEPVRALFEERYVEAVRLVGDKFLESGEIATAWAYFRAIGEPDPVARALADYQPSGDPEKLSQVIEVAFNQGANPGRGFELILEHYGTCSAITALEQMPNADEKTRVTCVERLVRSLHGQILANVRGDIAQRGQPLPPEGSTIEELVTDREWLFSDEAYHIDISHLSSTVRNSILLTDPAVIALAADLTEYGRRLSPKLQYEGAFPFERTFDDHRLYFRALLGKEVDAAIEHFRGKIEPGEPQDFESTLPAQVLVNLLARLDRLDEAIDLASEYLGRIPESSLLCPGIPELCLRANRPDRLASIARSQGSLVHFASAVLQSLEKTGASKKG